MKTEPTEARCHIMTRSFGSGYGDEIMVREDADEAVNMAFKEGQSSPKIKQLEWIGSEGGNVITGIAIYAGYYRITSTSEGVWMRIATAGIGKRSDTVDEAKGAVQGDFEKRVMECLDIADNSNK